MLKNYEELMTVHVTVLVPSFYIYLHSELTLLTEVPHLTSNLGLGLVMTINTVAQGPT